jgi:hypothetical protein
LKIAIIGTHGTFKSTLAYNLAGALKEEGLTVRVIQELAADCPYPINGECIEAQEWIVGTQFMEELKTAASKDNRKAPDAMVCDRSILDSYAYTLDLCLKKGIPMPGWIPSMVEHNMPSYDYLFKTNVVPGGLVDDGTRCIDPVWQKDIENILIKEIEDRGINRARNSSRN